VRKRLVFFVALPADFLTWTEWPTSTRVIEAPIGQDFGTFDNSVPICIGDLAATAVAFMQFSIVGSDPTIDLITPGCIWIIYGAVLVLIMAAFDTVVGGADRAEALAVFSVRALSAGL